MAEKQVLDVQVDLSKYDTAEEVDAKIDAEVASGSSETLNSAKNYTDQQDAVYLQQAKDYTDLKASQLEFIKFVDELPATGDSKYIYAVLQDERTLDDQPIFLLFLWDGTEWANVGVESGSVDPSVFQPYVTACQAAQAAAETAQAASEEAEDNANTAKDQALSAQTSAESAKTAAETAKTQAETFASNAETNATTAQTQAGNAQTFAQNALSSATNAETYSDLAKQWAIKTDETVDETEYSSKYYAQQSAQSASQAESKVTLAQESATNAASSASQASSSAQEAKDWANKTDGTVDGVEYSAKHYANLASGYSATAQTSASSASTSAQNAASSATEAENALSQLTSQVELAQTAATNAQNYASAAQTSASNAASSETNASNSASSASQSATNASNSALTAAQDAQDAEDAANAADLSATSAAQSAQEASASASQASQSAIDAANSAASARGLQIGTVYFSQSSLATDNPGGLPLWKGEYFSNASSLYPDFYNWVKSHTELCKTKTQYNAAISTYGECPYYVVDEVAGSLRLPKLANYLKMANATDGITQSQAGLPNITGNIGGVSGVGRNGTTDGVFRITSTVGGRPESGSNECSRINFNARRSSAFYGRSSTVTPAHTTIYPWVYAFNSAVSASEAQAAEFTGALSGKANTDLSNVSSNIDYVVETYRNSNAWYRLYKSGWVEQGGIIIPDTSENITVSYLKPFSNLNYTLMFNLITTRSGHSSWDDEMHPKSKLSTGFTMYKNAGISVSQYMYYACGKGA